MKRALLVAVVGAVVLHGLAVRTSAQSDALSFFKNYFITGDYVVGGVGLYGKGIGGVATDSLVIADVPPNTDIVAAFLYWQAVSNQDTPDAGSLGARFKGNPLSSADGPFAVPLGTGSPTCTSSGGGTGSANGSKRTFSYRAEVLRFFDVDTTVGSPNYGKLIVNGAHQVQLPDGGDVQAIGATLVVVYADPTKPLSAIVMYDGSHIMDQSTQGMSQTIRGFYDGGTSAKLTHIVGSGQANKSEILRFNGAPIATNPFVSAMGAQWDNPTFLLTPPALSQVTTSVDHEGFSSFDCLTWSAVVYRTTVNDTDGDGLLDVWESSTSTLFDPNGQALPNLNAMGADPGQKDLFVEIGYMATNADTSYGGSVKPAHSHLPSHAALKLVGDAFWNAPTGRIKVHFDVGNDYPVGDFINPANNADQYILRGAGLARGGEAVDEQSTVCAPGATDPPWVCQYSAFPGTVGWKAGFRFLRDEVLPGRLEPLFDSNRKNMFHYAFFAHLIGLPKSALPCLDAAGNAVADVNDTCAVAPNPAFHTPRTNTGIGDFPGADVLVTLGGFSDVSGLPIGTPAMQAFTLMHELGHNMSRRHGGEAREPNCKPTYLSVMNYLYQLRGLLDDAGKPHLDFSRAVNQAINETMLADGASLGVPYRIGWYAPLAGSYLDGRGTAAKTHCDGSPLAGEVPMVRIDARTAASGIDWNANGLVDTNLQQDVNFNGRLDGDGAPFPPLAGSDDWSALALNQIGARRNVGALYIDSVTSELTVGPLSLDVGKGDLGKGDLGKGDLGKGDLGKGDLGKGDLGKGDLGKGDLGKGDLGKGDLGGGDLFDNDPNNPGGELDVETAGDLGKTPPNEFRACVIGVNCPTGDTSPLYKVRLDWATPNFGGVLQYVVYRVAGGSLEVGQPWTPVGAAVTSVLGQTNYTLVDHAELVNGALYTYFAVAVYDDGIHSDPSNFVTITAISAPPTISDIADVTIDWNTSTTLNFTIGSPEGLTGVSVSGSSSNIILVPVANIVFGGSGTARTVTVTPAANQTGTTTITVTVTGADGRSASDTFVLTVQQVNYTFFGVQNAPPPAGTTIKAGSAMPMQWQFRNGTTVVVSSHVGHSVTVRSMPTGVIVNTDAGSSSFRYDATTNTWQFNLQTKSPNGKNYPAGNYEVKITPSTPGFPEATFQIVVK